MLKMESFATIVNGFYPAKCFTPFSSVSTVDFEQVNVSWLVVAQRSILDVCGSPGYSHEINNENTRSMARMCSKLTIKTPERHLLTFPAGIHLFKINNENIRTMCEVCSKLTIKTPERHQ